MARTSEIPQRVKVANECSHLILVSFKEVRGGTMAEKNHCDSTSLLFSKSSSSLVELLTWDKKEMGGEELKERVKLNSFPPSLSCDQTTHTSASTNNTDSFLPQSETRQSDLSIVNCPFSRNYHFSENNNNNINKNAPFNYPELSYRRTIKDESLGSLNSIFFDDVDLLNNSAMSNPARLPLQDFCYRNITDEELMYFLRKDAKVDDNGDNADNKRTESVDGAQNKSLSPPKESFSIANMPPSIEFGGESCYNNINNSQGNVNNFGLPAEGHTESALAMLDHYFPQAPIVDQQAQPVINHSQPFEGLAFGYNDHMQATEADIFGSNQDQTTFHSTAYHSSTINQQQQSNPNTNFLFTQAMEGAASSAQLYNILDCPGNNNQQPAETTTSYGAPDALPYFTNEQIQQMSLSNVRAMNRDIYLVRNCGPVVQNNPNPAPIYVGDASVFMNRQQQLRQTQHFERLSEQQIAMSQLHPENQHPKPVFSYSCLIAMALKNSESGSLPVNEIYRYMQDKFPYFKSAPEGWKNSVRHNLSLNKAFYKMLKTEGSNSHRKGCLWSLKPEKQHAIEKEINKWLRKHPDAIRASLSNSDEFNQLFQNVDESSDDLLDENMVTLDMNSISNFIQEQENIKNKQLQKQQQELLDYTNMLRAEVNHQNIVANSLGGRVNQQQPQHQFHSQLLQQHPQHQYHSQLLQQHPQQQQQQKYLPLPPLKIADQQINLQALSNVEMIEYLIRCQAASNYSRPATATDGYRDNLISNASTDHNNMQVYGSNIPVSNMIMVPANQLAIPNNMNSGQLQPPSVRSGSITGNPLSSHKFNKYSPPK